MLTTLSIQNVVLIDRLTLAFGPGLHALTGETGAGKSILLDALGQAVGARAERLLVRQGADQAQVTACFEPMPDHPVFARAAAGGLALERGEPVILRRVLKADGRSRAFVNDVPVSIALLQDLGYALIEVHGQGANQQLLDPAAHRDLLDAYGGHGAALERLAGAFEGLCQAESAREDLSARLARAREEADFLAAALDELTTLNPQEGEEERLVAERARHQRAERVIGDLAAAMEALSEDGGLERRLQVALRRLERVAAAGAEDLAPTVTALERALVESAEAEAALGEALRAYRFDPDDLEAAESRLFALRAAARKHRVPVDGLAALTKRLAGEQAALEGGEAHLATLERAVAQALKAYEAAAEEVGDARTKAAARLDKAVKRELKPLKLGKSVFRTRIDNRLDAPPARSGRERVAFEVATNEGTRFGPLNQIASGGELARFSLALKVVLTGKDRGRTLVFDEVDQGVGGAVASAVGERLARLASEGGQVFVVTHSPQVAARASHHLQVSKSAARGATRTEVVSLDPAAREEEVARMLSGARITDAARAAARQLLTEPGEAPVAVVR